ncbi:TMV resistance protein N-like [Prunus persica]|uniref:TMV resistance protein N-like n=1 Tax=Prunus persica TaxID=3760 RepID=UPI0009AB9555|nr:TMV resistance protein N-like [Prunus persica]
MNMVSMANQAASPSSSSFSNSCTYDVFLSFRGEDTRHNFTDHLYSALVQKGINTFIDDKLRRGGEISASLLKAIEESRISIIVFSTKYAAFKRCLDVLDKILECKKLRQQKVWPIFYKVEPSDVRHQRGSFGEALAKHECKFKNNIHKVHRWRKALSEAANLSGWTFSDGDRHESQFIRKIVDDVLEELSSHAYLDVATYPVGIESYVGEINKLLEVGEESVCMVGIWGAGGIGKTTIAKAVYHSIVHEFDGSCFLANVRENSMPHGGLVQLQETLLIDILRVKKLKVTNVDKGVAMIKKRLSNKKVLLILDDVNQLEQLHSLARGSDWFGSGSRIIITTRDKHLLIAKYI